MTHRPAMVGEITTVFEDVPSGVIIDATYGFGGHTKALLEKMGNKFRFIGIDRDGETLKAAEETRPKKVLLKKLNFAEIPSMLTAEKVSPITGVLFDLGISSIHIDDSSRGFSYQKRALLDLRFDRSSGRPAAEILYDIEENELIGILKDYGQERNARAIARGIKQYHPSTTDALADLIKEIVGPHRFNKAAARVFQAIRIYVNDELESVKKGLSRAIPVLAKGGRIAVISYHSIEDGIVKRIFSLNAGKCFCGPEVAVCRCGKENHLNILTKKPLRPSADEVRNNPRARSARLRYAEKI
ncbi:MAG: 16S rRNA (cytosine(1402)-N(4))-methyltransferase RsmH [candidate division Zixibacteria bacterium]